MSKSDYYPLSQHLKMLVEKGVTQTIFTFREIEHILKRDYHQLLERIQHGGQIHVRKNIDSVLLGLNMVGRKRNWI